MAPTLPLRNRRVASAGPDLRHGEADPTDHACSGCGASDGDFAPSGRCLACEDAVDIPTAERTSLRQIGEVAALVGLSLRTVRHYEDAGLVLPAARTTGGFRLYDDDAIERLRLIMQMKPLGFTLDEMRLLIEARTRLDKLDLAENERTELEGRVAMFAASAAEKCEQLRQQLMIAEGFARALSQDPVSRTAGSG